MSTILKASSIESSSPQDHWAEETAFDLTLRRGPDRRLFVLLDCVVGVEADRFSACPARIFPIEHRLFDSPPAALLEITRESDAVLSYSLDCYRHARQTKAASSVAGWLISTLDGDALASKLRRRMASPQYTAQSSQPLLLFSSKVVAHLPHVMRQEEYDALRKGIEGWAFLDARGELDWLPDPDSDLSGMRDRRLPVAPAARIAQIGLVNNILDSLPQAAALSAVEAAGKAHALLERLDVDLGPRNDLDKALLTAHALLVHADFHRHPQLASLLSASDQGQYTLAAGLNRLSEDDMERIGRELKARQGG